MFLPAMREERNNPTIETDIFGSSTVRGVADGGDDVDRDFPPGHETSLSTSEVHNSLSSDDGDQKPPPYAAKSSHMQSSFGAGGDEKQVKSSAPSFFTSLISWYKGKNRNANKGNGKGNATRKRHATEQPTVVRVYPNGLTKCDLETFIRATRLSEAFASVRGSHPHTTPKQTGLSCIPSDMEDNVKQALGRLSLEREPTAKEQGYYVEGEVSPEGGRLVELRGSSKVKQLREDTMKVMLQKKNVGKRFKSASDEWDKNKGNLFDIQVHFAMVDDPEEA